MHTGNSKSNRENVHMYTSSHSHLTRGCEQKKNQLPQNNATVPCLSCMLTSGQGVGAATQIPKLGFNLHGTDVRSSLVSNCHTVKFTNVQVV